MENNFEWDKEKATLNFHDHGVSFANAAKAFLDLFVVEWIDDREDYGEERTNMLATVNGVVLHVTYTERAGKIRLISARKATKHEQDRYYRETSI